MDRFIVVIKITIMQIIDLKSNMDRFIGLLYTAKAYSTRYLKSNMDRFIETSVQIVNVYAFI